MGGGIGGDISHPALLPLIDPKSEDSPRHHRHHHDDITELIIDHCRRAQKAARGHAMLGARKILSSDCPPRRHRVVSVVHSSESQFV